MADPIHIASKFESFSSFVPSSYDLFLKHIDFVNHFADCELEIGGIFRKTKAQIKFTSILPIISKIQISLDSKTWINLQFDKIYEELATNIGKDNNRLIEKKAYIEYILNKEDSMGGNNICVYLPHSIQNKISNETKTFFKFYFNFYYDIRVHYSGSDSNFDSFYIPCFYTPALFNPPSGGYKPCLWMPCLNRSLDSTTWSIRVSVPTDMICISTGEFLDISDTETPFIKVWNFKVDHPTNPGNIFILAGKFQSTNITENFCCYSTQALLPYIETTVDFVPNFVSYFENGYGFKFPYSKFHFIFLSRFNKFKVFGNLVVLPVSVLTTRENILQRFKNYKIFGKVLVEIIFGTLILPNTIADLWLVAALNRYFYFNFIKKYFGVCEFFKYFNDQQKHACEFPTTSNDYVFYLTPHVFLSGAQNEGGDNISIPNALHFWYISSHPKILSTKKLWKCFIARCGLAMLSIERNISSHHLLKVISKILSFSPGDVMTFNRPSTEFFFSSILNVSGKDIYGQITRNWLSVSRPLFLTVDYCFNRRKSCVEVTVHNEDYEIEQNIPVNISITVQEIDNVFEYSHQIRRDARKTTFEISSRSSKIRRPTVRKRIPTEGGREIDVDFLQTYKSANGVLCLENSVVFLRINMDLCTFFGRVRVNQSECAWIHQAYIESNPLGHLKAIKSLKSFPSEISILILTKLIKNKNLWYHARSVAYDTLVMVYNKIRTEELIGLEKDSNPIDLFKLFFCFSGITDPPKINDFSNIPLYLFQLNALESLSKLKFIHIKDPKMQRRFLGYEILRSFFEFNDNTSNIFNDCCYRAKLLKAVGDSLDFVPPEISNEACNFVLFESLNSLKLEQLEEFPHYCVSYSAIFNIFKLQKMRHLTFNSKLFHHYCSPGIDIKLRTKCIEIAVQFVILAQSSELYRFILDMISCDPSWEIRFSCVFALQKHPLFQAKIPESLNSKINSEELHKELQRVIEFTFSQPDSLNLYAELSEFYNYIYGEVDLL